MNAPRTRYDTLIHGGTVVTVDPDFRIIKEGLIGIADGCIRLVEAEKRGAPLPMAGQKIDAAGGIVIPGLVNTHTHMPMTIFRGLADDLPLQNWLNQYIFPAEAAHLNPESVQYGALLACAEMIRSGTTTCCDGYFFEDVVAEAVDESGLRAILGQGVVDFPAPGVPDPSRNIEKAIAFADHWRGRVARIQPSIFCHSPYTCSAETLTRAKQAARERGALFQIHAAETKSEQEQIHKQHRATPIAYLDRLGILDPHTLLVHAIWLSDRDIEIIAERGAGVSVTTESEMKLASGIAPLAKLLGAGVAVGLGTDGTASNNDMDLFQEMDVTAKLHKVQGLDPTAMDAETVLTMATMGGAKALGLEGEIGSLAVGKQADIVIIDAHQPHLLPLYNPVSQLVYSARGSDVRDVMVAGRLLMKNRKLLTLEWPEIAQRVTAVGGRIGNDYKPSQKGI